MARHTFLLFFWVFSFFAAASIKASPLLAVETSSTESDSIVGFGERFSFHTNVIDWCLAVPNVGIEWDLSGKKTSRYSLGVHAKYRPGMWSKINPRFVFNVAQVRGEFRRYWRTFVYEEYDAIKRDTTLDAVRSLFSYFRNKRLSGAQHYWARDWRAYYIGLYAEIDKFTFNFNKSGRQGSGGGFGVVAGYTLPVYPMRNGASIDVDLGVSVGARLQSYDKFVYEEETHCYVFSGVQERSFVKYPVLADAHVSLVYRFNSIANKVQDCDKRFEQRLERLGDKRVARRDKQLVRRQRADSLKEVHRLDSIAKVHRADSIAAVKEQKAKQKAMEKEAKRQKKEEEKAKKKSPEGRREEEQTDSQSDSQATKEDENTPESEEREDAETGQKGGGD